MSDEERPSEATDETVSEESPATSDAPDAPSAVEASELHDDAAERPAPPARASEPPAEEPPPPGAVGPAGEDSEEAEAYEEEELAPRRRPEVPGADLEPDIVPEGEQALGTGERDDYAAYGGYELDGEEEPATATAGEAEDEEDQAPSTISGATIDLASGARYRATGKRKTACARVILRPGTGEYRVNGRPLAVYFPRATAQRIIRQPLETVGYEERMDVVATMHGGGVSAQAGALRHGISRALLEADPKLRGELKRRGFLTRDQRVKERKKAGLKKARKRPQFSKR